MAEALDVDVAARLAEPPGAGGTLTLYLGDSAEHLLLREISLQVDDQQPLHYEYSDSETLAIERGALHEMSLTGLGAGTHRLRADFTASEAGAKPGSPRKHGQIMQNFSLDSGAAALELNLVKGNFLGNAALESHPLEGASLADARLHATDFLAADGRYFAAASVLRVMQAQNQGTASADALNQRLSANLQGMGLAGAAAVSVGAPDPAISAYNSAMASIQQGKLAEGAALLETVGSGAALDSTALALRDQANLALGYALLRHHQGAAAVPVFSRVRSPGPCASAALLGLGWALLAPPGNAGLQDNADAQDGAVMQRISTVVTPRLTADIAALRREQPASVPVPTKDQQTALLHALLAWTELTGRDPTDPAVQEGMLAIAWSLYHYGAYEEAQDDYLRAIDQFDKTRGWYDTAILGVRSGGMASAITAHDNDAASGWHWSGVDLPPQRTRWWLGNTPEPPREVPANFYFERLMLDQDFAGSLRAYRDLHLVSSALTAHLDKLDAGSPLREQIAALRPRIDAAADIQRRHLEDLAVSGLQQQKKQLEKYLIEARFALASIYDRPAAAGAP
jgi:tetratricopeptide (TPR) repeat protein